MAIFHFTVKVISRGKGQSAIAAAAYRSGERLRDEQSNEQKFYRARAERIMSTDIMAPTDAPEWAHDRNALWNNAERAEKRKDAQLAREFEFALPHELNDEQREWLVRDFVREAFTRKGYAADFAIHAPDKEADDRNHHAHVMVPMRAIGAEGFAKTKDRSLNSDAQLTAWRSQWAHLANRHLERHGHDARIDHRSLKDQGVDREPGIHLGYAANEMAGRGAQSDRWDALQEVIARNDIRIELKGLDSELAGLQAESARLEAAALAAARKLAAIPPHELAAQQALDSDEKALRTEVAKDYEQGARKAAGEIRQERLDDNFWARQEAWRMSVDQHPAPEKGKPPEPGLKVMNSATGAVSKLGDFVTDLLAGSTPPPPEKKADMGAYVSDPAARRSRQLERMAERAVAEREDEALKRIAEAMKKGQNLRASDIQSLTREHQEQIKTFGDSAVQQMVDASRKRSESYWKGEERTRDRDRD